MDLDRDRKLRRKRWFVPQFRLRDMFWIFVLTGVLALWFRDREQLKKQYGVVTAQRPSWSTDQITGTPDSAGPGDIETAWAASTQDGQAEWLIVEFKQSTSVQAIHIHETFNPGAVVRIDTVDWQGDEKNIWKGVDPTAVGSGAGVSIFKLATRVKTRRIKVYIDSMAVPGWNEIDAVAIVGADGKKQYAVRAWASSSFGDNNDLPDWFWP